MGQNPAILLQLVLMTYGPGQHSVLLSQPQPSSAVFDHDSPLWWRWGNCLIFNPCKPYIQLCHFCSWHLGTDNPLETDRAASHYTSALQKSLEAIPTIQSFLPLPCKWSMLWTHLNSRKKDPRSRTTSCTYRLISECTGPLGGRTPTNHAVTRWAYQSSFANPHILGTTWCLCCHRTPS